MSASKNKSKQQYQYSFVSCGGKIAKRYIPDKSISEITAKELSVLLKQSKIDIPCKQCIVYATCRSRVVNQIDLKRKYYQMFTELYPMLFTEDFIPRYVQDDMRMLYNQFIKECPLLNDFLIKLDDVLLMQLTSHELIHIRGLLFKCIYNVEY